MPTTETKLSAALASHQAGDLREAERLYREILDDDPNHSDALHLSGVAAHQGGDHATAVRLIGRAIGINDRIADFHSNIAEAHRAQGGLGDAINHGRRAVDLDPDHADAHNNLGLALAATGEIAEAETHYRRALTSRPDHAKSHNNLGILLKGAGKLDEAVSHYRLALAVAPKYADAHSNLGNALWMQGHHDDAFWHYRRALDIEPGNAQAMVNVGAALKETGRVPESTAYYRRAIRAQPNCADAHYNLGVNLADGGDAEQAIASYRHAVAADPVHVKAHKNLSVSLLSIGEFAAGFDEWEWRWREPDTWQRTFDIPVWDGAPLTGKTLLVWGEQGVGDEIMLASILPEVIDAAGRVVVECDGRLVPLFARSFPNATFITRDDPPDERLRDSTIDLQCAAGGLCRWLRREPAQFAGPRAYLTADPARVAEVRARYDGQAPGVKVGIAWRSTPRRANIENVLFKAAKSSSLGEWAPVLTQSGATFVNLQYGDCAADLAEAEQMFGVRIIDDDAIDQIASLEDFAAQIAALDLVIATSNTTVHMAGALGQEVWTLLAKVPDWRWQRDRGDSLWYPNMDLLRQTTAADWDDVMARAGTQLAARVGAG
ncbi:MAG: tetratricopeptide repeat protein [Alphaproteobacteria bacterium]|nr:tetratricopeptide repeat protein [Alphaproteobacteria bacterium]MDP6515836.1 tetratricopeptide repeat protein [Alphaproteobacteria bacterium]